MEIFYGSHAIPHPETLHTEFRIYESSVGHMGDSEHSLEEMGGMIITTDQGGFFGTEWDDMQSDQKNSGLFRE